MFTITITFREKRSMWRDFLEQLKFLLTSTIAPLCMDALPFYQGKRGNIIDRAFITVAHLILRDQFIPKMEKCTALIWNLISTINAIFTKMEIVHILKNTNTCYFYHLVLFYLLVSTKLWNTNGSGREGWWWSGWGLESSCYIIIIIYFLFLLTFTFTVEFQVCCCIAY